MNQRREIYRRKPAAPFQCTNLRNTEHRTETIEQHIGFGSRPVEHLRDTVVLDDVHAFGNVRQQGANMRGRRTQVVRDTVACALDFRHQPFDLLEHVIHQMREHIELVAPAYGQAPVQIALGDAQGDVADVAHSPHLPQIKQQAAGYAHKQAEQTAANERVDHRLANMQDVREIAGDHDLFAAVATYSHRPYDWRPDVMGHNQGTVERVARAVERQIRGYRHDIAGDVFAVGVEQAEVISMQVFAFRAPVYCRGQFRVVDGPEIEQLPMQHRVRVELHACGGRPADKADQHHDRQREDYGVDRHPPEGRFVPAAPHFHRMRSIR